MKEGMRGKNWFTALSALFLALVPPINSQPRGQRMRLIELGQFHGDEISAKTGQRWLGLYFTKHRSVLRSSRLKIRNVFDDVMDYGTRKKTGKRVGVNSLHEPIFLLSQAARLRPGPVITTFNDKHDFNRGLEKFPATLKLGHKTYILKVVSPDKNPVLCSENSFPWNAHLILSSGKSSQILYTLDACGNEPYWYLLWAGDLDRDGKLDLYVNVTQHYDVSERKLFLSSQARKGKLVGEVASFETGGC